MFPEFHFLGRTFAAAQLPMLAGILLAGAYAMRRYSAHYAQGGSNIAKRSDSDMLWLLIISAAGAMVGGSLLYALVNCKGIGFAGELYATSPGIVGVARVAVYLFGGSVYYGGLFGGLLCARIYAGRKGLDRTLCADIAAAAIPLFHAFGRISCFLSGCCYGIESRLGFAYSFSRAPGANGPVRLPVQLIEAGFELALFFIICKLRKDGRAQGRLLAVYLGAYACGRFLLEFLRGDLHRGNIGALSVSQWISIALLLGIAVWYAVRRRQGGKV